MQKITFNEFHRKTNLLNLENLSTIFFLPWLRLIIPQNWLCYSHDEIFAKKCNTNGDFIWVFAKWSKEINTVAVTIYLNIRVTSFFTYFWPLLRINVFASIIQKLCFSWCYAVNCESRVIQKTLSKWVLKKTTSFKILEKPFVFTKKDVRSFNKTWRD